jgi:hypothetical protein
VTEPTEKGTPQAFLVMGMIDAWLGDEDEQLETLLSRALSDFGSVFGLFVVVLGGTIRAVASEDNREFDEVLSELLTQLAARADEIAAADVARQALTAWSVGDDELVVRLGISEDINNADPMLVLLHFLAMLGIISGSWANQAGVPMSEIHAGWVTALGTTDDLG